MSANPSLDYHEHLSTVRDEYDEHAHEGNTPGHTHPDQELGPRDDVPEAPRWFTLSGPMAGKPTIITACGAPDCTAVVWCGWLGSTHLALLLRSKGWSQTKARGWVCPDHKSRRPARTA